MMPVRKGGMRKKGLQLLEKISLRFRNYATTSKKNTKKLLIPAGIFPARSNLEHTLNSLIPQCGHDVYMKQYNEFLDKAKAIEDKEERLKFVSENLFILQDGPPYANGDLHLGHALNKILKDFINRFQMSQGKYVHYKPGWDCHGLPIELKALKTIKPKLLNEFTPLKLRSVAHDYAASNVEMQKERFKQYGIMTNWDNIYMTMNSKYELDQLEVFQKLFEKGMIKRQNKPVFWGTETRTAMAESELEYHHDHKSTAAYVNFRLTKDSTNILKSKLNNKKLDHLENIDCLIWTSTPWTLFSNRAICYNKDFEYSLVKLTPTDKSAFLIATKLIQSVDLPEFHHVLTIVKSENLEGLRYTNGLTDSDVSHPLIHGDHVTEDAGTGLVHTAPGHGADDYLVGVANSIEVFSPVDHEGRYILEMLPSYVRPVLTDSSFKPRKVLDTETAKTILDLLQTKQMLLKYHEYTHSYPYDWRSKKPIIIRATPQWFTDLHDVKAEALSSLENVKFVPERGEKRLKSFLSGRNEWCISRQRSWGVPIPVFYEKENPENVLASKDIIEHAIIVIRNRGIESWFEPDKVANDMEEWLPESYKEVAHKYARGKDTLDVWFDSGTAWRDTESFYRTTLGLEKCPEQISDVYLEGSDQHRGWFQSSLLTKIAFGDNSIAPFKTLVTHGFTLDADGLKMSKSLGNVIAPGAIISGDAKSGIKPLGVDGLRLLVAQADFTTDMTIGKEVVNRVGDALKKFRASFRFLIGNLEYGEGSLIPINELRRCDKFLVASLQALLIETKDHYKNFNYSQIVTAVQYHMRNYLSSYYFDISKTPLYCDPINSLRRRQTQVTLNHILNTYRAILGPILPTLIQEVWNYIPENWKSINKTEKYSPFGLPWPNYDMIDKNFIESFTANEMVLLKEFKRQFHGKSGEITKPDLMNVTIYSNQKKFVFTEEELADILQVASVKFVNEPFTSDNVILLQNDVKVELKMEKSELHSCPRCWKANSLASETYCKSCEETMNDGGI